MKLSDAYDLKINGKAVSSLYADDELIWGMPMVSVQDLIDDGYATVKECVYTGNVKSQGYGATYYQIQIEPSCPYRISNIEDFDAVLTNSSKIIDGTADNYFVWNKALPAGWKSEDIIAKYNGVSLSYAPSALYGGTNEKNRYTSYWFDSIDFSSCKDFTLVINAVANWNSCNAGLLKSRAGSKWTSSPEKFTLKFLSPYSSVAQYLFGKLNGTKQIVLDFSEAPVRTGGSGENMYCRDMAGVCEWDSALETIEVKGKCLFCDGINISNAFHGCSKLKSIPLFAPAYGRTSWWNTWPVTSIEQAFLGCGELVSIMPALNMANVTYAQACSVDGAFGGCSKLSDVRFTNITGAWDFYEGKCQLRNLDADSINYILNNVVAVSNIEGDTTVLRFAAPSSGSVSADAIAVAETRGYTVVIVPTS